MGSEDMDLFFISDPADEEDDGVYIAANSLENAVTIWRELSEYPAEISPRSVKHLGFVSVEPAINPAAAEEE